MQDQLRQRISGGTGWEGNPATASAAQGVIGCQGEMNPGRDRGRTVHPSRSRAAARRGRCGAASRDPLDRARASNRDVPVSPSYAVELRGNIGSVDAGHADHDANPSKLKTQQNHVLLALRPPNGCFSLAGFCLQARLPRSSRKPLPAVVTVSTLRADPPSFSLIAPPPPAGTKPSKHPNGGLNHAWHC